MTYLQGIHSDLMAAGYGSSFEYTDPGQLKADIANRNDDTAFARLYLYWYNDLCKIGKYPLYSSKQMLPAYPYVSEAEKSDVEQEILSVWIKTMVSGCASDLYNDHGPADIRRMVAFATKKNAQDDIREVLGIIRVRTTIKDNSIHDTINPNYSTAKPKRKFANHYKRMVMPMVKNIDDMPLGVADTTNRVLHKDTARFVNERIERFLADKSPEYRKVFKFMLEKKTICEYDGSEWETKHTEDSMAKDIGKPKHVVTTLKARIRKDFAPYWAAEIKPYI